ncbi:MAG: hypothetical protein JJT82_05880 [Legionellaceae bacterium]|nr:hypothetical protein [Legionellaceae bacterium]
MPRTKKQKAQDEKNIRKKLTDRYEELAGELANVQHASLQELESLLTNLNAPVVIRDGKKQVSIEDCDPSSTGPYKLVLPKGYQKDITRVAKAIERLKKKQDNQGVQEVQEVQETSGSTLEQNVNYPKNFPAVDKIERVLGEFAEKIASIGIGHVKAQQTATDLLGTLRVLKGQYLCHPSKENLKTFVDQSKDAINQAMPILQKDLGWGDYLQNVLKKIANAVAYVMSAGYQTDFFAQKKSLALQSAVQMSESLTETYTEHGAESTTPYG